MFNFKNMNVIWYTHERMIKKNFTPKYYINIFSYYIKNIILKLQCNFEVIIITIQRKYYRLSSSLRIGAVDNPFYVWTSIIVTRRLLLLCIRSNMHSGYEINVWQDPWIPSTPARPVRPRAPLVHPKMTVSSLIDFESKECDAPLQEQYVDQEDIQMIQSLAISHTLRRDTFCWSYTKNGQYTIKSGYWAVANILTEVEEK